MKGELKQGSIVKTYVLFVKKGSGIALSLNKKTARKGKTDDGEENERSLLTTYFPQGDELAEIKEKYSAFEKHRGSESNVGKVYNFRVCESKENYYVAKTIDEKKQKVAILPKCVVSSFDIALPLD